MGMEQQQRNLNAAIFNVQNTTDFRKLKEIEREDYEELNKGLPQISKEIFDKDVEYDEQIRILGEIIAVTLLANNHRRGYILDKAGLQSFRTDFRNDFGILIDDCAVALNFVSVKHMLLNEKFGQYVKIGVNSDAKEVLKGRSFENVLLDELLADQKAGHENAEQKAKRKEDELAARLNASKINPEAVEGRLRIYKIISLLSPSGSQVSYQEVQQEYERRYRAQLNKTEFKKFFGSSNVLQTLEEVSTEDLDIVQDRVQNGMIYLKLKRDFKEIEAHYKKMLDEATSLPSLQDIVDSRKKEEEERRARSKPKKTNIDNKLDFDQDKNELLFESTKITQQKIVNNQKTKDYTSHGYGQYSGEDDDSENEDPSENFKRLPAQSSFSSSEDEDKVVIVEKETITAVKSKSNLPTSSSSQMETKVSTKVEKQNLKKANLNQASTSKTSVDKQFIIRTFVFGFLNATAPLLYPIDNLVEKAELYMESNNLQISKEEIESLIYSLRDELSFYSDDKYVKLSKSKK